ncbi:MAG: DNA-processing protein DprA [Patescibacteria group bacterium]
MEKEICKLPPEEFPPLLREINDPPAGLYLEGVLPPENHVYLTVVGSRRHSRYGQEVVEKLISGLTGYPIVIVSGLAIGLDTIAHRAALDAGLLTLAVPGSGLDRAVLHPSSNRLLADKILAAGGGLLSELEPLAPAGIHTFPRRNRIMAGLAKAVLVIEAGEKSGTMITARLALDYNRDVYAVPGSIFSPTASGTNQLIRDGATPITSSADLLLALGFELTTKADETEALGLSSTEQRVVEILTVEPLTRDDLLKQLALPIAEANACLSALEIRGVIREQLGEISLTF